MFWKKKGAQKDSKEGRATQDVKQTDPPDTSKDWTQDEHALEMVASTASLSEGASVLRENARLHQDIRDAKKRAMRIWIIVGILIVGNIIMMVAWLGYPKYRLVATLDNQAICEVPIKEQLAITPQTLLQWAADAAVDLYSIDYVNYRLDLQNAARKWLSKNGQASFFQSLDRSRNLRVIVEQRLIVKAIITQVPQLEQEGRLTDSSGRVANYWEVRMPIQMEFYANGNKTPVNTTKYLVTVQIVQTQPTAFNQRGLAIENVLLSPPVPS